MSSHADTIVYNGRVRTFDRARPWAESVAVRRGKILAVGSNADLRDLAGADTTLIDAAGGTVIPGIVDAHNHVRLGSNPNAVRLTGAATLSEIKDRLAAHVGAHPDGDWIEGEGWEYQAIPGGIPDAEMIDDVCCGRPAWLFSYDVHSVWLNREALRRFGAQPGHTDLPFGRADLDPVTGEPTGFVRDFAVRGIHPTGQRALEGVLPGYSKEGQYLRLVENLREAARLGITTIVEPQNGRGDIALFERARAEGELQSRLVAALIYSPESPGDWLDEFVDAKQTFDDDRLRVAPIKLYIDDVVEPHTAAMLAPWANAAGCGHTFWSPEDFADLIVALERRGLQAFVHATGDRGIRTVLDGVENARKVNGPGDFRHQIVHVECLDGADLHRFSDLGVVACMQPRHCAPDLTREWRDNVGTERERYAWAMRSLQRAGAALAFSSDWNVASMDPLVGVYTAMTRADLDGKEAWNVEETVDLDTALAAYTQGAAYANFAENDRGSLVEGNYADLVVLSDDLYHLEPSELLEASVTTTMVGGQVVYQQI